MRDQRKNLIIILSIDSSVFVEWRSQIHLGNSWPSRSGVVPYIIYRSSVSLSDDNFRKPWRKKFIFPSATSPGNKGQVRIWRSSGQGQGHMSKKKQLNPIPPQCETSVGNSYGSIKYRAMKFACCIRFSTTAYRMVWPISLSCDRKWPRVSKCTHSRLVGLRLKAVLFEKLAIVMSRL